MSDYQGTYLAWGPPGTGKTTYLGKQVRKIVSSAMPGRSCPVLVCSLTKSAAAEVAGRDLPLPRGTVGTLHSMAYRAIGSPEIAETHLDDWNQNCVQYRMSETSGDIDEAGWDQPPGQSPGDDLLADMNLLRARMTPRDRWPARIGAFAAKWETWKIENSLVDFTDMIAHALEFGERPPGNPKVIIADEAQDHSSLEYSLLVQWGDQAGALIMTGDPWQALYTWRGAHPELFIDPSVPDDHKRVLSQSYRIPRAVHAKAMGWVRQLSDWTDVQYKPRDFEGEVILSPATWKSPERAIALAEKYLDQGKSVMFQMACGYMLGPLLSILRKRGVPFSNPWRYKHGGWNPLRQSRQGTVTMRDRMINFLRPDAGVHGQEARTWTFEELDSWASVMKAANTIKRGCKAAITLAATNYPDTLADGRDIAQWFEAEPMEALRSAFESRDPELCDCSTARVSLQSLVSWWSGRLLKGKAGQIDYLVRILNNHGPDTLNAAPQLFVGTIHSFKGGEADTCFLFPDLSPRGWCEWSQPGKRRDGVVRLMYVGMTRAKETLILCDRTSTAAVDLR